ncbi:MAG: hypothetical protein HZC03_00035 [Candidatus Lloydbacteria bacterium]|nr:hypothetical protein [Candidatus Lloydbacteria bacterium]
MATQQSQFEKAHYKAYLYGFLKWLTVSYVGLQLISFHVELDPIPDELSYFWMATLLVYTCLKETFRHLSVECGNGQNGEWYAIIVISVFLWMEGYNVIAHWIFGNPYLPLPDNMFESAIQSMILLIAAALSSLWFHCKRNGTNGGETSRDNNHEK